MAEWVIKWHYYTDQVRLRGRDIYGKNRWVHREMEKTYMCYRQIIFCRKYTSENGMSRIEAASISKRYIRQ